MDDVNKLFDEFNRLVLSYKRHLDYFDKTVLEEAQLGSYNFRLTQMLELVPKLDEMKNTLDDLEMSDVTRATIEESFKVYEDSYQDTIGRIQLWVSEAKARRSHHGASTPRIKFPTIALPEFDGSLDKWMQFRDSFEALVHKSDALSVMEKYHYLRSAIKLPGGQLSVLSNFALGEAFYEEAWKAVRARYDDERKLKTQQFNTLLTIDRMTEESPSELRRILDSFSSAVVMLKQLGATWDDMMVHVVGSCLDDQTNKDWQKFVGVMKPTWEMLKQFLTAQWRSLDQIPRPESSLSIDDIISPESSFVSNSEDVVVQVCRVCKEDHKLPKCRKFKEMDPVNRFQFVKKNRLCYNCLGESHSASNCLSSKRCDKCECQHHNMLHFNRPSSSSNTQPIQPVNQVNPSGTTLQAQAVVFQPAQVPQPKSSEQFKPYHLGEQSNPWSDGFNCNFNQRQCFHSTIDNRSADVGKQTLLSTVLLMVADVNGNSHLCRALLDSGSTTNVMSRGMAEKLQLKLERSSVLLTGINTNEIVANNQVVTKIASRFGEFNKQIQFSILEKVCGDVPSCSFEVKEEIPMKYFVADPCFNQSSPVDMLLGANVFYDALLTEQKVQTENGLKMISSKFGWIISGEVQVHTPIKLMSLHVQCDMLEKCQPSLLKDNSGLQEISSKLNVQQLSTTKCRSKVCRRRPQSYEEDSSSSSSIASVGTFNRFINVANQMQREKLIKPIKTKKGENRSHMKFELSSSRAPEGVRMKANQKLLSSRCQEVKSHQLPINIQQSRSCRPTQSRLFYTNQYYHLWRGENV